MAEDSNPEVLQLCWQAMAAVAGSIPKEMMPSYVRTLKDAVGTARQREHRKHRPKPLRVAGFCLPKALQPVLPIFLQGVLQVEPCPWSVEKMFAVCAELLAWSNNTGGFVLLSLK